MGPAGTGAVAAATPQCSPRGQPDSRPPFPFRSLPLPPASLPSAPLTWRLGAGRRRRGGGGLRGAPGRLSRMLRGREPCSCHGRSSLCSAPAPAPVLNRIGAGPRAIAPPPRLHPLQAPIFRHFRFLFLRGRLLRLLRLDLLYTRETLPSEDLCPDLTSDLSQEPHHQDPWPLPGTPWPLLGRPFRN